MLWLLCLYLLLLAFACVIEAIFPQTHDPQFEEEFTSRGRLIYPDLSAALHQREPVYETSELMAEDSARLANLWRNRRTKFSYQVNEWACSTYQHPSTAETQIEYSVVIPVYNQEAIILRTF